MPICNQMEIHNLISTPFMGPISEKAIGSQGKIEPIVHLRWRADEIYLTLSIKSLFPQFVILINVSLTVTSAAFPICSIIAGTLCTIVDIGYKVSQWNRLSICSIMLQSRGGGSVWNQYLRYCKMYKYSPAIPIHNHNVCLFHWYLRVYIRPVFIHILCAIQTGCIPYDGSNHSALVDEMDEGLDRWFELRLHKGNWSGHHWSHGPSYISHWTWPLPLLRRY